uniref:Uncharacterized protein n=1 Tax=Microbotryum lychnidis-dioicae TaxID=288795 RepID=M1GMF3_9BASI|nr:hypothetical protein H911_mgp24 [Microbotryum lychnidis-dioicae]YP_007475388.1 hypothetical protein H911_mgp16 [Microbotryum lychnidis-dioicae]AGE14594.1 hypothetical protein [Microbotryum lychnidis-dioicae]AGE14602.1 hypothetical protein [Microbotryum lychnidis-dioicae]
MKLINYNPRSLDLLTLPVANIVTDSTLPLDIRNVTYIYPKTRDPHTKFLQGTSFNRPVICSIVVLKHPAPAPANNSIWLLCHLTGEIIFVSLIDSHNSKLTMMSIVQKILTNVLKSSSWKEKST